MADRLTAQELSTLAGLSRGVVALIESGVRDMGGRSAVGIAHVLGVSLDWLLAGEGKEPAPRDVIAAVTAARNAAPKTGTEG